MQFKLRVAIMLAKLLVNFNPCSLAVVQLDIYFTVGSAGYNCTGR